MSEGRNDTGGMNAPPRRFGALKRVDPAACKLLRPRRVARGLGNEPLSRLASSSEKQKAQRLHEGQLTVRKVFLESRCSAEWPPHQEGALQSPALCQTY